MLGCLKARLRSSKKLTIAGANANITNRLAVRFGMNLARTRPTTKMPIRLASVLRN
jgi:hypothetical protein